ncbi:MAG TPA: type IV secretion system DNA-binding domain-containing protein [Streptosporangiaceae bacterium]
MLAMVPGHFGRLWFDSKYLSRHVLFLGGIGTGKSNAMYQLLDPLRANAGRDDVFVIFDTKGDFLERFYRDGDAVISSTPDKDRGGVTWNLFSDLLEQDANGLGEQVHEIASTVFSEGFGEAGENLFFAMAARDIFAAVVEAMARQGRSYSNEDIRRQLELPAEDLLELLDAENNPHLAGVARYLEGDRRPEDILAFLQQTLNKSFSGVFRLPGSFSVRNFIRRKGGRALFVEYDIASGNRLLPVYRVLIDMAIKEALGLGRAKAPGSVFFVLDEFALLPQLEHISNGINFGRSLGLKFLVGTQNVNQVLQAYGAESGASILSGFGSVLAFRLMDDTSRELVRQRFGANRKQITVNAHVRSEGVQQLVVAGNVIEDWVLSNLSPGQCIVSLPEGGPFFFAVQEYSPGGH